MAEVRPGEFRGWERVAARWRTDVARATPPKVVGEPFLTNTTARITDLLLMGMLVCRIPVPGLPAGSFAQLAMAVIVVLCLFRRPVRSVPAWLPLLLVGLMAFLVAESVVNGVDFLQRALNLSLSIVVTLFLASGRIDIVSAIKGMGLGLAVNIPLFYAGVLPDRYQGKLTGLLLDKNVAGMHYAVVTLLACLLVRSGRGRAVLLVAGAAAVVLTDSRTSMAAYGIAVAWLLVAPRVATLARIGFGALLLGLFVWAEANLAQIGSYAIERAGSDELRARIGIAADAKTALAPWYGLGLGEAYALIDDQRWFFHDSYLALLAEGGIVMLVAVVGLYLAGPFALHRLGDASHPRAVLTAATGALLLCATRLGEVFLTQLGFVLIGIGLALLWRDRAVTPPRRT